MSSIRHMRYTKDNGETSERDVIVVSYPKVNHLMYDVTSLTDKERNVLINALAAAEEARDNAIAKFEVLTGIKQSSLWRSFKPEGIEWVTEDEC